MKSSVSLHVFAFSPVFYNLMINSPNISGYKVKKKMLTFSMARRYLHWTLGVYHL